ncbi:MAG TPA: peptide deformylase [Alphaproteobacteria bacterium]|nr:peptide deformylase [Alphaproteobacteria bacterium]
MALRTIITAPDPRLKVISEPVQTVTDDLRRLMDDMLETMYKAPGIGLAAVQIGVPKRIIVIDLAREDETKGPHYFINPVITWASPERAEYEEGCLSVPDLYDMVERPARIRARFLDYHGAEQEQEFGGLMATCLQHEMDHLEGVLFIDHLSKLKRDMMVRKLLKVRKASERV